MLDFSKKYFSISAFSTGALIVVCNLSDCLHLNFLYWLLIFLSVFACGMWYQWGAASPSLLGYIPPSELNGISPSEVWRFFQKGEGSIPGLLFIYFLPWFLGASQIDFGDVGVDDVWPTGESL